MNKIGNGFKNFNRTQIGIFAFLIGLSIGCMLVMLFT